MDFLAGIPIPKINRLFCSKGTLAGLDDHYCRCLQYLFSSYHDIISYSDC